MLKKFPFVLFLCSWTAALPSAPAAPFFPATVERFMPETYARPTTIELSNGIVFDTRDGEPGLPANLALTGYPAGTAGYYIIQFDGPIYEEDTRLLESAGAGIEGYLPNYSYIVKLSPEARNLLASNNRISYLGIFQPAYKVSREIDLDRTRVDTVIIVTFAREPLKPVTDLVAARGGTILLSFENKWRSVLKVAIPPVGLSDIVRLPAVRWVEPFHEMVVHNAQAQWVMQTFELNTRDIWDKGIRGQGQILSNCDTGIRTSHDMFRDPSVPITHFGVFPGHRKVVAYQRALNIPAIEFGDEAGHGTHTSGTLSGDDSFVGGGDPDDGMAPESKIYFLDGSGSSSPGNIAAWPELSFPVAYNGGARIISNSWGGSNRGYDAMCASSDQTMWDHPDYLVLYSAGNDGPTGYVGSPGNAKDVVTVGATGNGASANQYASYSSIGPSGDGRMKPTVTAPGSLNSAFAISDNAYTVFSGTSMSCPALAGNAALIRQYFSEGWYPTGAKVPADGFPPSAALMKAMFVNSAVNDFSGFTIPSYRVGWGRPRLDHVLCFSGGSRTLKVIDDTLGLETGMVAYATLSVASDTVPFRVTLVWTDYPGAENALRALVNDLNLEVTAPSGDVYKGNVFASSESKTGGTFDQKNVEENVFIKKPAPGTYQIKIKAQNVPFGPQPFALVATGALSSPLTALSIAGFDCDDSDQSNEDRFPDPGETVILNINLKNSGDNPLTGVTGTLAAGSGQATVLDPTSDYGTIVPGAVARGDGFKVAIGSTTAIGDTIPFTIVLTQAGSGERAPFVTLAFTLQLGAPRYPYANHDIGNSVLTVTEWGSIGFHDGPTSTNPTAFGGKGFRFPRAGSNWLYLGSLICGTGDNYVCDRMYGSANTDWRTTVSPSGKVTIGQTLISDQDSRARFNDAGNPSPKGLEAYQRGFAWKNEPNNDFVILRYKLANKGPATISGLYAGIMADFDMPADSAQQNQGGVDAARRLAYIKRSYAANPHVGVKLLYPPQAANVSMLENPVYVYQGQTEVWSDAVAFGFLKGTTHQADGSKATDWSVFVSAGPYNLPAGGQDTVAFAFVGGDNLANLQANADRAQALYDTLDFIEQPVHAAGERPSLPAPGFSLAPPLPTPFHGRTTIAYQLPRSGPVTISVYDALGVKVRTLVASVEKPGMHRVAWNGTDTTGRLLPGGVYFCRMQADGFDRIVKTVRIE